MVSTLGAGGAASGQLGVPRLAVGLPPAVGLSPEHLGSPIAPRPGPPGPVTVFVELTQPPTVDVFSAARASGSPTAVAAAAGRAARGQASQAADRVLGLPGRRGGPRRGLFR